MPASNDPVRTRIHTSEGTLTIPEYFSREDRPEVTGVRYEGSDTARAPERVITSILEASRVILAPSEPVLSIGAILTVSGVRDALTKTEAGVVAISPVVAHSRSAVWGGN